MTTATLAHPSPDLEPQAVGGTTFRSRLILGTGKYADAATMRAALEGLLA